MHHPIEIEVTNDQSILPIDEATIRAAVEAVLRVENVVRATVAVSIVDDPTIHAVNREHLDHDDPTDVISFAYHEAPADGGLATRIDGEVIASAETAVARADEFRWSAADELVLYVVHGLLHVVGYDDRSESDRNLMRSRERAVLRERGLVPRYHGDDGSHAPPPGGPATPSALPPDDSSPE